MSDSSRSSTAPRAPILQRLFALQEFSLASYAAQAELYRLDDAEECFTTIRDIAAGQAERASRIAKLLAKRRVPLARRGFRLTYTGLNYLSADHAVRRLLDQQPALIAEVRSCVAASTEDPEVNALAYEVMRSEQANLGKLRRVAGKPAAANVDTALAA